MQAAAAEYNGGVSSTPQPRCHSNNHNNASYFLLQQSMGQDSCKPHTQIEHQSSVSTNCSDNMAASEEGRNNRARRGPPRRIDHIDDREGLQ